MPDTSWPLDRSRAVPRKVAIPPMRLERARTRANSASIEKSSRWTRTSISSGSAGAPPANGGRTEEHTTELPTPPQLLLRLLLLKKKKKIKDTTKLRPLSDVDAD